MNYADIKPNDINNGEGIRVSLWVTGCPIKCPGCHNKVVWDKDKGTEYTNETQNYIIDLLRDTDVSKDLSILGGEPLAVWNYEEVLNLCKTVKKLMPEKHIQIWTGYTYETIKNLEIFKYIDILVDGKYIESLKDESTWWRGSSNQRMIFFEEGEVKKINV